MSQLGSTRSLLGSLNQKFAAASADNGKDRLGPWPNEPNSSDLIVDVLSLEIDEKAKFEYGSGSNKKSRDAIEFQFKYCWQSGPNGPMTFDGAPMTIPLDWTGIPNVKGQGDGNQQARAEIAIQRLKGCFKGLLGQEVDDLDVAIAAAKQVFEEHAAKGARVQAKVYLKIVKTPASPGKAERLNKDDFIQERV